MEGLRGKDSRGPGAVRGGTARLGDSVTELMERRVLAACERYERLVEAWEELVPADIREHVRIGEWVDGELKVFADSASYVYELRLCSSELLEELRRRCPGWRLRSIRFLCHGHPARG